MEKVIEMRRDCEYISYERKKINVLKRNRYVDRGNDIKVKGGKKYKGEMEYFDNKKICTRDSGEKEREKKLLQWEKSKK